MTHTFKLARRAARFRTPFFLTCLALTFGACSTDRLTNSSTDGLSNPIAASDPVPLDSASADAILEDSLAIEDSLAAAADPTGGLPISDEDVDQGVGDEEVADSGIGVEVAADPAAATTTDGLSLANAFVGGIPYGTFHLPKALYGRGFNGSLANISRWELISYLETARRTGTKVMVTFAGNDKWYKTSTGAFSLTLWKQRVNRYKGVNLTAYIKDGTLLGHYLTDEPHNPARWGGRTISRATLDEMARYSKQLWPTLPTVVRGWPAYLKGYNYRYLDAAWAQYSARFGPVSAFMQNNVRDAKASGLALVIGMNQLAGGNSSGLRGYYTGRYSMSASQLRTWGAAMLVNSYPCAFLSWQYNTRYMSRSDIKSAGTYLAGKARSKAARSCRGF